MEQKMGGQIDAWVERVGKFLCYGFDSAPDLLVQVPWVLLVCGAMLSESSVCPLGVKGKGPSCFPVGHCGQRGKSFVEDVSTLAQRGDVHVIILPSGTVILSFPSTAVIPSQSYEEVAKLAVLASFWGSRKPDSEALMA